MDYQEKTKIQEKVLAHAEKVSTKKQYKHAYAFGMVWAMLNDEQVKFLEKHILEEK